jgi:hypothetical protein
MCDSRTLSRCSIMANALWPRLIVQADDQGRLHGDAQDIRGLCFPKMPDVTVAEVAAALQELAAQRSLRLYERRGEPYIQISDWWQYQSFQRRAYPSRYPCPPGWMDIVYGIEGAPATFAKAHEEVLRRSAAKRRAAPPSPSRTSPSKPIPSEPAAPPIAASGTNGKTPFDEKMTKHGVRPDVTGKPGLPS